MNMSSEGTKLGEYKNTDEFSSAIKKEEIVEPEVKATKLGEISEFEKSLGANEASEGSKNSAANTSFEADNASSDDMFQNELDRLDMDYEEGDIIEGTVRSVEKSGIMVDINYKSDGYIANSEYSFDSDANLSEEVKPGDKIKVFIVKLESKEGYTVLSKKRADHELAWSEIALYAKNRTSIEVKVASKVQGGLVAEYRGIRGFIPGSQVIIQADEDLEMFVGQTIEVNVLQVDRRRRKVIFSHKQAMSRQVKEDASKLLEDIDVGQTRDGRITSVKEFGVFVDLGGLEGLVHISELSWSRVLDPTQLVNVGDEVKVFVLGVDKENGRISLGMKQLEPDPWASVNKDFEVGQVVDGTISRVVPFGAFIQISNQIEGLIHISELSYDHVEQVADIVKVGQVVQAKIIKLIPEEQKIGLTLKGLDNNAGTYSSEEVSAA